jgi:acyl-CoA reductase-like NAD-dependent aldehyde dehydrogenase
MVPSSIGNLKKGRCAVAARYLNYIGGIWIPPAEGEFFENRNPADSDDCIGLFLKSGPADVAPDARIAQEEIFGPVLSVLEASDLDDAFRGIRDIEAGITYVNGPTIGAEVQLPFGGVKDTGNGHREASHTVLDTFSECKSVYVDYRGRLQKAQIDAAE